MGASPGAIIMPVPIVSIISAAAPLLVKVAEKAFGKSKSGPSKKSFVHQSLGKIAEEYGDIQSVAPLIEGIIEGALGSLRESGDLEGEKRLGKFSGTIHLP
jgi:hypothetical protein